MNNWDKSGNVCSTGQRPDDNNDEYGRDGKQELQDGSAERAVRCCQIIFGDMPDHRKMGGSG
jgi:hypothetical protein